MAIDEEVYELIKRMQFALGVAFKELPNVNMTALEAVSEAWNAARIWLRYNAPKDKMPGMPRYRILRLDLDLKDTVIQEHLNAACAGYHVLSQAVDSSGDSIVYTLERDS